VAKSPARPFSSADDHERGEAKAPARPFTTLATRFDVDQLVGE